MTPHGEIAVAFASALVEGDFARAHGLLAPALRDRLSPSALRAEFYAMFRGYTDGEPMSIDYDEQFSMTEWPDKEPHDVGSAYVGIIGEGFVEAADVTVAEVDGRLLVRLIEWGRP
jgi:hypothetical protein